MSNSQLDLATADDWFGFRPGMTRADAEAVLEKQGIEETLNRDDYFSTAIGDIEIECWFETTGRRRLRQVGVDGEGITWKGRPLVGVPLHDALRAMEPFDRAPAWDVNDAGNDPFPVAKTVPSAPLSGEMLLEESTIWLPDHHLGLMVCDAEIIGVVWREARDLPKEFVGAVSDEQRQLSKRPDLSEYLREKRIARQQAETPPDPLALPRRLLAVVCLGLLAWVGYRGFQETIRWNNATMLKGKFVSAEQVARKKYFDLGPAFIRRHMPDDSVRTREVDRIEYLDPAGRPQTVALERGEFYIAPRNPGEEVEIAYVAGDPPRVKGLSRARDAAFLGSMPWAIAVGVFYFVGRFIIAFPSAWRSIDARKGSPKVDADRPELR